MFSEIRLADYSDITRLRIFMLEPGRVDSPRPVLTEVFGDNRPATTVIKLQGMADAEVLVEIEMRANIR